MKKALALLLLTLLTLIPLPTLAEDDAEASLRVGWFPADRYGQYAEFIPFLSGLPSNTMAITMTCALTAGFALAKSTVLA